MGMILRIASKSHSAGTRGWWAGYFSLNLSANSVEETFRRKKDAEELI